MSVRDFAFLAAGIAIVIAACGTPGDTARAEPTPDFADGTRIKARWTTVTFADGAKGRAFLGWWDSVLKKPCTPSTLSTETTGDGWCMPAVVTFQALFSDATCSTPIAAQTSSIVTAGVEGVADGVPRKLWTVGEAFPVPADVYAREGPACVARTWSNPMVARVIPADLGKYATVTIGATP